MPAMTHLAGSIFSEKSNSYLPNQGHIFKQHAIIFYRASINTADKMAALVCEHNLSLIMFNECVFREKQTRQSFAEISFHTTEPQWSNN
jgi:hypothetical protein